MDENSSDRRRAKVSVVPPAWYGEISVIGRDGYLSWAKDGTASAARDELPSCGYAPTLHTGELDFFLVADSQ